MSTFNRQLIFLSGLVLFQLHVQAKDLNETSELIVTGSHTAISTNEIGSSYTIITEEDIRRRKAVFVKDLLRNVPGFAVSSAGSRGSQTQVRVRGSEANHLLVLIDGVEANDIASGDEFNFANLVTSNIHRIEIIRGPQSALYGSDAVSGVINIITKKGSGEISVGLFSEAGSFGTINTSGNLSAGNEHYNYSLSASHLSTAGTNISRSGNEDDGYVNDTLSFSTGISLLENLKFNLTARHTETETETDTNTDNLSGLPIDTDSNSEVSRDYIHAQIKLGLFDHSWEQIISTSLVSTENDNFLSGTESSSTQGKKLKSAYQSNFYFDTSNIITASHTLTLGLDYEKDFFTQNAAGTNADQRRDVSTFGYIAGYKINLADALFLSASIRHDDNNEFNDATTHRLTAAYNVLGLGTRIHTSYGTGVKRPTFIERFGFFSGFVGNPGVSPEKSEEWDIGIQQAVWHDRATVEIVYFNGELENEIIGAGATVVNLEGTSKRAGIEFSASAKLTENLSTVMSYTWLDANEPNGEIEVRRPRNEGSLNLNYVFLDNKANLNLNVDITGSQADVVFPPANGFARTRVRLDDYILADLVGSYKLRENVSVYAKIENLLNTNYENISGFQTPRIGAYAGINLTLNP